MTNNEKANLLKNLELRSEALAASRLADLITEIVEDNPGITVQGLQNLLHADAGAAREAARSAEEEQEEAQLTSFRESPEIARRVSDHFMKRMREAYKTTPDIPLKDLMDQLFSEGQEIAAQYKLEAEATPAK